MNTLFAAALEVQSFCSERRGRLAVIGGLAVQRWGEPRQTRHVDITLLTGLGGQEAFVDSLLGHFVPRLPDARQFALLRRVVLVETSSGIPGRPVFRPQGRFAKDDQEEENGGEGNDEDPRDGRQRTKRNRRPDEDRSVLGVEAASQAASFNGKPGTAARKASRSPSNLSFREAAKRAYSPQARQRPV